MARGLSDLQKYIIKTAAETPGNGTYRSPGQIYNFEICEGYYGWKAGRIPRYALKNYTPKKCEHEWTSTGGKYPQWKCCKCDVIIDPPKRENMVGNNNFEPLVIGENKYNSVQVAIHKASERLEKRGLVERIYGWSWRGVRITEKGKELVSGWRKAQST